MLYIILCTIIFSLLIAVCRLKSRVEDLKDFIDKFCKDDKKDIPVRYTLWLKRDYHGHLKLYANSGCYNNDYIELYSATNLDIGQDEIKLVKLI
jgi:hypothetical protein